MILTSNYQALQKKFPSILEAVKATEIECRSKPIEVVPAKNGEPTLLLKMSGRTSYIHSQYDPTKEAESIISQYKDVGKYDCVLFYGVGLGYHIKAFTKKYPDKRIVIYEPKIAVFYQYLCTSELSVLNLQNIDNIFLEFHPNDAGRILTEFLKNVGGEILVITLPTYERLFQEQTKFFLSLFKEIVKQSVSLIQINHEFSIRWVTNSISNFNKVLNTRSVLRDCGAAFEKKPVILVSAGPSLQMEVENLKRIKEARLAYIFAVGSANKVLLAQNILPDAVCSYDPTIYNEDVFKEIIDQGIKTIPLIFGSSVGKELLHKYPGPLLHFITSQDTVAANYLNKNSTLDDNIIGDEPSIAVIMLQILFNLKCGPIILVGQNLAINNNQYYSTGIEYVGRTNEIMEEEIIRFEVVNSVEDEQIYTLPELNLMRKSMERMIARNPQQEVINTTKGGAAIAGSQYVPLIHVMEERLQASIVQDDWYQVNSSKYNIEYASKQAIDMEMAYAKLKILLEEAAEIIRRLDNFVQNKDSSQLEKWLVKLGKTNKSIFENICYKIFVQPMCRSHLDIFNRELTRIKRESNALKKAQSVVQVFGKYFYQVQFITINMVELLDDLHIQIKTAAND